MRGLVIAELTALAAIWAAFVVFHARSGGWRTRVGRQLMAMAAVGMVEALALIAAGTGHAPPLWIYAVVFGVTDLVAAGWLGLLWRARNGGEPPPGRAGAPPL